MFAQNIVVATQKLQHFGFRSKLYAYFFLCATSLMLVVSAIVDSAQSLSSILAGLCMLLIPTAIYLSGVIVEKITDKILKCRVASMNEFDSSFKGPFSGMSWVIFTITFFLACAEVLFDYYFDRSFGTYSVFLVTFTLVWLARFYVYFRSLKQSVLSLKSHADSVDPQTLPDGKRAIIEEAQRGNTETIVDKRDDIASL